jgi:CubicO group peptidase (beta-lactamase class C family)
MVEGGYHVYPELAAAGLWTTPSDLARFMMNVSASYRADNGLLGQTTVRQMLTKIPGAGGLGFGVDGSGETLRFRHSGGNAGFTCYAVCFAQTGRGVVIMTNSDNGTALIHELVRAIARQHQWPAMWPRE